MSQTLTRFIKDGRDKACPLCNVNLNCFSHSKEKGIYRGREFWCPNCYSKFFYFKCKKIFNISLVDYRIGEYRIVCSYSHKKRKQQNGIIIYTIPYSNSSKIKLDVKLDFPLSSEQLEEKISILTTFS
jgi:hypothetical protein